MTPSMQDFEHGYQLSHSSGQPADYQPVPQTHARQRIHQAESLPMHCTETTSSVAYLFELGATPRQALDVSVGAGALMIVITYAKGSDHLIRYAHEIALPATAREDTAMYAVDGDTLIVTMKKHMGIGALVTQMLGR